MRCWFSYQTLCSFYQWLFCQIKAQFSSNDINKCWTVPNKVLDQCPHYLQNNVFHSLNMIKIYNTIQYLWWENHIRYTVIATEYNLEALKCFIQMFTEQKMNKNITSFAWEYFSLKETTISQYNHLVIIVIIIIIIFTFVMLFSMLQMMWLSQVKSEKQIPAFIEICCNKMLTCVLIILNNLFRCASIFTTYPGQSVRW